MKRIINLSLLIFLTLSLFAQTVSKKEVKHSQYLNLDTNIVTPSPLVKEDGADDLKEDMALDQMDYVGSDDDDYTSSQNISGLLSASGDLYTKQASYSFSPMRFNIRGYSQWDQNTSINGIYFNGLERGNFNYSMLGGLNKAFKRKEITRSLEANNYGFGGLGASTNIEVNASNYAPGTNLSISASNRSYYSRIQAVYATGLMDNGWAFAGSGVIRYANEGAVEGSPYESAGYFFSAEKRITEAHRLYFVTFGAPTNRGQGSAVTEETTDLMDNRYYNPYWGYQDGEKRNSRMVESFAPTAILNYEWDINEHQLLTAGLSYQYSLYSKSALTFYNAPDPRPDYYRYLPSYLNDGHYTTDSFGQVVLTNNVNTDLQNEMIDNWTSNNTDVTQINWDNLYQANYANNVNSPDASAKYALERRHNDLMETALNLNYKGNFLEDKLVVTSGVNLKSSTGIHYTTMEDLLGANQWIDIDPFSERDLTSTLSEADRSIIQNDVDHPNRVIKEGDTFGNDYDIVMHRASAYVQNQWHFYNFDGFYGVQLTYNDFYRYGRMRNGRAEALGVISKGKGETSDFLDPAFKAGFVYKINGRHIIQGNMLIESRAPLARNAYISPRVKDTQINNLESENVQSFDMSYNVRYPNFNARVTGFYTTMTDGVELNGFYNDEYHTFTNVTMSGVDKVHQGIEMAAQVQLNSNFSLVGAATFSDNHYTSNAVGQMSTENGVDPESGVFGADMDPQTVYIKDLKVNSGPQLAASLALKYFNPKMWFADLTLNYFDENYLDFAPSHFMHKNLALMGQINSDGQVDRSISTPASEALASQEQLDGGFLLDLSIGHMIYLKNSSALTLNVSVANVLNTRMVTGGYQQGRVPVLSDGTMNLNYNKFPNKYYYNYGTNFYLNIGYRF